MKRIALLVLFVFVMPRVAECLLAQDSTQKSILKAAEDEVSQLKEMINQQKKMVARLSSSNTSTIQSNRNTLINSFKNVRKVLQASDVLTHLTDNIESALKNRHPEWKSGMKISELKSRNENRDAGWKKTMKAYLKSVNMTTNDFNNDNTLRSKLIDILKTPEGQTQALQTLGAILDHANMMLVRNENTIQGFMAVYLEYERDNIDRHEQKNKSILEMCSALQSHRASGSTSYRVGF